MSTRWRVTIDGSYLSAASITTSGSLYMSLDRVYALSLERYELSISPPVIAARSDSSAFLSTLDALACVYCTYGPVSPSKLRTLSHENT